MLDDSVSIISPYFSFFLYTNADFEMGVHCIETPVVYHKSERFGAIKPGLIHYFLPLKMSVPSHEYDNCCPFV